MGNSPRRGFAFDLIFTLHSNEYNTYKRFFSFQRRSSIGSNRFAFPRAKAFLRRFVQTKQTDPLVVGVKIINLNPNYVHVGHLNGRDVTFLCKTWRLIRQKQTIEMSKIFLNAAVITPKMKSMINEENRNSSEEKDSPAHLTLRRSARTSKDVFSRRYGTHDSSV